MNRLFENIGDKIKLMAKILLVVSVISSIGFGVMTIIATNFAIGLVTMIVGLLISVFLAYIVYGFGELINNTKK